MIDTPNTAELRGECQLVGECWKVILQKGQGLLEDYRGPLVHLCEAPSYFNLPPLPTLRFDVEVRSDALSQKASFKNLSEDTLLALRMNIYAKTDLDRTAHWAETLMRFCEVRYSSLRKRAVRKCDNRRAAGLHLLQLSAFLLDYGLYARDIRFLNTVLKLSDLAWIVNRESLVRNLDRTEADFISALFQVRLLLITEYAVRSIGEGKRI